MTSSPHTRNQPEPSKSEGESKDQLPAIKQPDENDSNGASQSNAPLAPPPKPSQNGDNDYFSGQHGSHLSKEPNPFENAFGGSSATETPGKT
ncbi:hypothetical protein KC331_g22675, partial [Hortaea werneckii]